MKKEQKFVNLLSKIQIELILNHKSIYILYKVRTLPATHTLSIVHLQTKSIRFLNGEVLILYM